MELYLYYFCRGEKVTIMYDPGMFPAILKQKGQRDLLRNGGGKV